MNVLVIGYGSMGRRHAANARSMGHEVGVQESDPDRTLAAVCDGFLDANGREGWLEHVDAVVVATPATEHVRSLLAWGWSTPIFVEKPLACAARETIAVDPGTRLQVGYNWRWHPLVSRLRDGMRTARGAPSIATFWVLSDRRAWPGRGYADALLECSHEIDLALDLLGPADLVSAKRETAIWSLNLRHTSGCQTRVLLSDEWRGPEPLRGVRISWRGAEYVDAGYDVPYADPRNAAALEESYRIELGAFLRAAADGRPMTPSYADGLAVLRICDQARAMAGGQR